MCVIVCGYQWQCDLVLCSSNGRKTDLQKRIGGSTQYTPHRHRYGVRGLYRHTVHLPTYIHKPNTNHLQWSVCLWQLESPRLSVRKEIHTCTRTQIHNTINVKTAALAIQSRAPECLSFKGITQQDSFHWKELRNYRQRNSLQSHLPQSSCAGPAPQTHWRVIISA